MSETVDVRGAADLLKVHPETVKTLIADGAIPAAKVGRAYVMLTRDVLRHIQEQIIKQTASRMRSPGKRQAITPKTEKRREKIKLLTYCVTGNEGA